MNVTINGQQKTFSEDKNLESMIKEFCQNSDRVIAELNGQIIKSPQWESISLKNGDTLELVSFVGGG